MISILYVDDDSGLLHLGKRYLEQTGEFTVHIAESADAALKILQTSSYDAVISDYKMPGMDGIEFLKRLRSSGDSTPFIIFTGKGREEVVIEAFNNGADFYLQKGGDPQSQFAELIHMIETAVTHHHEKSALEESESKYRDFFRTSRDPVFITALGGEIVDVNASFIEMTGYDSREELLQVNVAELYENPDERRTHIQTIIEQDYTKDYPINVRRKDGSVISTLVTSVSRKDADGNIVGFQGTIRDITEKKRAEEALRESEDRYRSLAEASPDQIFIIGEDDTLQYVNSVALQLFRLPMDQVIGKRRTDLFPPDIAREQGVLLRRVFETGEPLRQEEIIRFGHVELWIDSSFVPLKDKAGRVTAVLGIARDITDRKNTEIALKESEERFRELFSNMSSGVAVYRAVDDGADFIFQDMNRAAETIDHVRKEEIIGKSILKVFPGVKEFGLFEVFQRVSRSGISESHPVSIYQDNRISGWRENFVYKLPSGEIVAIYEDVTEKKQAEEAIRAAREWLGIALRAAHAGTWDWDILTGTLTWSPEFFDLFGFSHEVTPSFELWLAALHPDDREPAMAKINQSVRDHSPLWNEFRIILSGDKMRWIGAGGSTTYNEAGEPLRMSGICMDITKRRMAEEALRESEERFRNVFDWSNDAIMIHTPSTTVSAGRFIEVNRMACQLLGYSREELLKMGPPDIVPRDRHPQLADIMQQAETKDIFLFETMFRRKDGSTFPVESNAHLVNYGGERIWISHIRDITERKRAEEVLTQTNKKLNLLSSITRHDILNGIAVLEGFLELAGEEVQSPGMQEYITHMDAAVQTIRHQIEFTKEYQEIGVKVATWQNVRETVKTAGRVFKVENVNLTITCENIEIFADPLLRKVFHNLFDNAYRYAPPFTTISVTCNETEEGLAIVFADDGAGLTEDIRKDLFERGVGKHTGLGLFLSREILAITGISITENGEPGKGARFEMTVPKGMYRVSDT